MSFNFQNRKIKNRQRRSFFDARGSFSSHSSSNIRFVCSTILFNDFVLRFKQDARKLDFSSPFSLETMRKRSAADQVDSCRNGKLVRKFSMPSTIDNDQSIVQTGRWYIKYSYVYIKLRPRCSLRRVTRKRCNFLSSTTISFYFFFFSHTASMRIWYRAVFTFRFRVLPRFGNNSRSDETPLGARHYNIVSCNFLYRRKVLLEFPYYFFFFLISSDSEMTA